MSLIERVEEMEMKSKNKETHKLIDDLCTNAETIGVMLQNEFQNIDKIELIEKVISEDVPEVYKPIISLYKKEGGIIWGRFLDGVYTVLEGKHLFKRKSEPTNYVSKLIELYKN